LEMHPKWAELEISLGVKVIESPLL
jgi:hypothetical protein